MVDILNKQINELYDEDIFMNLNIDIEELKKSKVYMNQYEIIKNIIDDIENINDNLKNDIIERIINNIKFTGYCSKKRGEKLNKIIKNIIEQDEELMKYVCKFEKKHELCDINEIPDFLIENSIDKKLIIGMNQISFWGGGHQNNRADKYSNYFNLRTNKDYTVKYVFVICEKITIKSINRRIYPILKNGINSESVCYPTNILKVIKNFIR